MMFIYLHSVFLLQTSFKDMKKTSNLEAYVNWFNRLSYLVTTEICSVSINMSQIRSMLCFHSKYKNEKM